ncbi:MAG: site-2 protease family protein [Candidatus Diapherotrites archaeon]|nr:site-2 protease family protein [Candidatus Diapherotrites archaeon]
MNATERNDLLLSWITLSIAFALVISDNFLSLMSIADALPTALIAVGTGFVFHEMAHRNVARKFGFHAEFRAWTGGLIFAVLIAVISGGRFIFAAPGATYIFAQNISREKNGKISIAGPITNLVIGFVLLIAAVALGGFFSTVLGSAALINFYFAFFNLLPFGPLDGTKVMAWNSGIWGATIGIAAIMSFAPGIFLALIGATA